MKITAFIKNKLYDQKGIKKNIALTFVYKGSNIGINLLIVPIAIEYLDLTRYGIWLTLTSIVTWFSLLDIGIANGLRNNLADALAKKDYVTAKILVSTTYAILAFVSTVIICSSLLVYDKINWVNILNTDSSFGSELAYLGLLVFISFGLKFTIQTINIILLADLHPSKASFLELLGNFIGFCGLLLIALSGTSSLLSFGLVFLLSPIFVLSFSTVFIFRNKYKHIKPSAKHVKFSIMDKLFGLGIQFFVIQIAVIVIFQSSNILITQLFSPIEVTEYNIGFKYFNLIVILYSLILIPIWSAYTHALSNEDYNWIINTLKNLKKIMALISILVVFMLIIAPTVISFWTNGKVFVRPEILLFLAAYTLIAIWNNTYSYFLNGISDIRVQVITSIIAAIIHVPIAIIIVKYFNFGVEGIVLSMIISLSLFAVVGPIKTNKIINKWMNL